MDEKLAQQRLYGPLRMPPRLEFAKIRALLLTPFVKGSMWYHVVHQKRPVVRLATSITALYCSSNTRMPQDLRVSESDHRYFHEEKSCHHGSCCCPRDVSKYHTINSSSMLFPVLMFFGTLIGTLTTPTVGHDAKDCLVNGRYLWVQIDCLPAIAAFRCSTPFSSRYSRRTMLICQRGRGRVAVYSKKGFVSSTALGSETLTQSHSDISYDQWVRPAAWATVHK